MSLLVFLSHFLQVAPGKEMTNSRKCQKILLYPFKKQLLYRISKNWIYVFIHWSSHMCSDKNAKQFSYWSCVMVNFSIIQCITTLAYLLSGSGFSFGCIYRWIPLDKFVICFSSANQHDWQHTEDIINCVGFHHMKWSTSTHLTLNDITSSHQKHGTKYFWVRKSKFNEHVVTAAEILCLRE